jgi:hypothetical protein
MVALLLNNNNTIFYQSLKAPLSFYLLIIENQIQIKKDMKRSVLKCKKSLKKRNLITETSKNIS